MRPITHGAILAVLAISYYLITPSLPDHLGVQIPVHLVGAIIIWYLLAWAAKNIHLLRSLKMLQSYSNMFKYFGVFIIAYLGFEGLRAYGDGTLAVTAESLSVLLPLAVGYLLPIIIMFWLIGLAMQRIEQSEQWKNTPHSIQSGILTSVMLSVVFLGGVTFAYIYVGLDTNDLLEVLAILPILLIIGFLLGLWVSKDAKKLDELLRE